MLQLITSPIHLLGHLQERKSASDTERHLLDLLANYKTDFGAGFVRSLGDTFLGLSLQYSIFVLMIGLINLLEGFSLHGTEVQIVRSPVSRLWTACPWSLPPGLRRRSRS